MSDRWSKGVLSLPIVIMIFGAIGLIAIVSIAIYLGVKDNPNDFPDSPSDSNLPLVAPEPLPSGDDWSFVPGYKSGEFQGDYYCENLYLNEDDPDEDCSLCQYNINQAKDSGKKENPEYENCPFSDVPNCKSCYFNAILDHDPRKCGGSWKITTTDPCGK